MIESGPIIKQIRAIKNLSRLELAEITGVDQNLISRLEVGTVASPTMDFVAELVLKLGVNINVFIKHDEPIFTPSSLNSIDVLRKRVKNYEQLINKLYEEMMTRY